MIPVRVSNVPTKFALVCGFGTTGDGASLSRCSKSMYACTTSWCACSKACCAFCNVSIAFSPVTTAFLNRALALSFLWPGDCACRIDFSCCTLLSKILMYSTRIPAVFAKVNCFRACARVAVPWLGSPAGGAAARFSFPGFGQAAAPCHTRGSHSARCALPLWRTRARLRASTLGVLVVTTLSFHEFDPAVQTPLYSLASHDASTQLPLTEFFIGCIFSNEPLDRQGPPSAHCNADSATPPQPADITTLCNPSSASHASDGHEDTTAPRVLPQPPPGLERYAHLCTTHGIPVKAAPVRPRLCTSLSVTPPQQHVSTTQVGTHPVRSATTYKRSASTALAGYHNPVGADPRAGTGPFPKQQALVLPMVKIWAIHT